MDTFISIIKFASIILPWVGFGAIVVLIWHKKKLNEKYPRYLSFLVLFAFLARFSYALTLTIVQYYVWSSSEITKAFLDQRLQPFIWGSGIFNYIGSLFETQLSYFLFYSFGRFWFSHLLAVVVAILIFVIFMLLEKRSKYHEKHWKWLFAFLCLLSGWPQVLLLFPYTAAAGLIYFLVPGKHEDFEIPLLASTFLIILFGNQLVLSTFLSVLRV